MGRIGSKDLPVWAVVTGITLMLALAGYLGYGVVRGRESDPGPPMKVYPGMYDLRAEAAKAATAHANPSGSDAGRAGNGR